MDSGNSASIQSSSTGGGGGGDDHEFDSHGGQGTIPAFFNQATVGGFDNTVPFQFYSAQNDHNQQQVLYNYSNFDLSNFSQACPSTNFAINPNNNNNNSNTINDLGMLWPKRIVDEARNSNLLGSTGGSAGQTARPTDIPSSRTLQVTAESSHKSLDNQGPGAVGRNPKKRTRASRRAPTTVLTTDTNNFRQMVQEFTGIPSPPFSSRTRLDIFGGLGIQFPRIINNNNHSGVGAGGDGGSGLFEQHPYVIRPFPQKIVTNNVPNIFQPFTKSSTPNTSFRPNATGSLLNEFVLGHTSTTTAITTTATSMSTTIRSGNMIMGSLNHGVATENRHGGEGMMDSWICSSD